MWRKLRIEHPGALYHPPPPLLQGADLSRRLCISMKQYFSFCAAVIATLIAVSGCVQRPDDKVLADINKQSVMAGLRPISPDWRLAKNDRNTSGTFLAWVYGSGHRWAGSGAKTVQLDARSLMEWSEDFYYSGRKFNGLELENMTESLTIHFDYVKQTCAVRLITDNKSLEEMVPVDIHRDGGNPRVALQIADNILKLWKAKRDERSTQ
jgi:hypothetical protein